MAFNFVIFIAALWALSSEMIEDSLVDLIYGQMFGWRNLVYAMVTASAILVVTSSILLYYASTFLIAFVGLISKGAAILLIMIGVFWLGSSIPTHRKESEVDEVREKRGSRLKFLVGLQLVFIEELEIFLILVPLILSSHTFEAISSAGIGIAASVSLAAFLRKDFEKFVVGRMRYLKIISGLFLVALGVVLFSS